MLVGVYELGTESHISMLLIEHMSPFQVHIIYVAVSLIIAGSQPLPVLIKSKMVDIICMLF